MTEHKELVDRLRAYAKDQGGWHNIDDTCEEAARVIEEQAAEIARLRGRIGANEIVVTIDGNVSSDFRNYVSSYTTSTGAVFKISGHLARAISALTHPPETGS